MQVEFSAFSGSHVPMASRSANSEYRMVLECEWSCWNFTRLQKTPFILNSALCIRSGWAIQAAYGGEGRLSRPLGQRLRQGDAWAKWTQSYRVKKALKLLSCKWNQTLSNALFSLCRNAQLTLERDAVVEELNSVSEICTWMLKQGNGYARRKIQNACGVQVSYLRFCYPMCLSVLASRRNPKSYSLLAALEIDSSESVHSVSNKFSFFVLDWECLVWVTQISCMHIHARLLYIIHSRARFCL